MINSNLNELEVSQDKLLKPTFAWEVEDTTGGVITILLVVFALAAIAIVVYTTIYPLGTFSGLLNPSLEQSLPIQSFPQVKKEVADSAHQGNRSR